ncbi:MAG: hypothetical protein M3290_06655 [Actinomycetota bacterium]|nr:hypothetical protein [Actinomycetota bacterium]
MDRDARAKGPAIDLEALEKHAGDLYLHRFVEAVRKVRGEFGRYLRLRAGDEVAIRAAADGSSDILDEVKVEEGEG